MKKNAFLRLTLIIALVSVLIIIGKFTAVGEWFNIENITEAIRGSGPWGFLMFTGLFAIGSLCQIPAMLFVLAAILIYGQINGTILGFAGVIIAMTTNFFFIRIIGGKILKEIKNERIQKILGKLEAHPIGTIIVLRLILWASPFLNYLLAMTAVRSKDFIIGSSIGIIVPVIIFSTAVYFIREWIVWLMAG